MDRVVMELLMVVVVVVLQMMMMYLRWRVVRNMREHGRGRCSRGRWGLTTGLETRSQLGCPQGLLVGPQGSEGITNRHELQREVRFLSKGTDGIQDF